MVALEDGRCIELHQDLDGRVDCRARDVTLGRDCSTEIMFEGAPDGSRWLGLDRRSFLATACVRQTELLQVKADASALQHHLQRAADTAGVDQTAAAALERIEVFRAENVGQVRANSNRPLPRAMRAVDDAHREVRRARTEHADYLKMIAEVDRLQQLAQSAQLRLDLFRAAVSRRTAEAKFARLSRVRELKALVPQGAPAPLPEDDDRAQRVRAALDAWQRRPAIPTLEGESMSSSPRTTSPQPRPMSWLPCTGISLLSTRRIACAMSTGPRVAQRAQSRVGCELHPNYCLPRLPCRTRRAPRRKLPLGDQLFNPLLKQ